MKIKPLIIEPGVTLLFAPTKQFMVKGILIAERTNDERITLASLENHSTTNHLINYSISRNLRFLNESGYPSGKLELFDSNKWHKVCFRRNEDKINQDYFVKSICFNFGYRKGWIKKSFNSAGFRIALISSCSDNHIQSFDFRDYCYLRTDLNGSFTWYYQECFEKECMNESSFVHHWGGLVIDGISKSEKTNLSFVDINEAGDFSNGLDGFALDLRGNNDFKVPLSAIYLSSPSEHNGESLADFRIKNSIFVNNTIGINVIDWIGNLSIQSNMFYLNEIAIMKNDKTNLEWKIRVKNCTFFRNKADFSLKMNPKRNNVSSVLLFEKNYFLETEKESVNVYLQRGSGNFSLLINLNGNNFEKINSKIFNLDLDNTYCYRYYCTLLLNLNVSKNSFVSNNVNDVLYLNLKSVLDKSSSIVIENNDFINNRPREKNNNPNSILNIGPNVTILFSSSTELIVEGKLNISGSLYQPVQFLPITKFDDLNKEKRLRLNDLKYLIEGSKITFSGRIESKIENKWYSLCADHTLKETYFEKMCQWMGFEMYVGYTVAKFNGSFIHNMTCSYNSLDSCSFEICHVNCECINHVMLTCKSYSTDFKGIHLTQYARRSKINNLKLAGYGGYGNFWNGYEAAIQIDYKYHELENIILETTDRNTVGVWFMDCPYEAISIFNTTVFNSFISLRIDNFRSNFTADGLFGNDVNISPNQLDYYILQYKNPLCVYGQICARLITLGKADLVQIISSILITSDCYFRIRAEDKSSFLLITDQIPGRWSFEKINEFNQTINVSTLQGNKKILQPYYNVDFYQFFIKISNNTSENILDALNIVEGITWSQSIVKDSLITIESNKFYNCLRALYYRQFNEKNKISLKISNNIFENSLDAIRVSVQFDGQRPFMVLGSVISIESNSFHNCSRCIRNENNLRKAKINWHINDNKINNLYSNTTNSQLVSIQGNGTFKNNVIINVTSEGALARHRKQIKKKKRYFTFINTGKKEEIKFAR
ncbi:bark beetle isoform X1 [Brachionus plicatilis]|uniref:Bark beetle isoform X1 n=1 Tax=Brachionus plicatilis TaxID=10195 RepID=A0A3M7SQX3_BRAPC|nr:bark beetle isoform X1 [Brachionus plicatilis]